MKAYEIELRERLIAALTRGMSLRAAAALYGVDPSTASRWSRRLERSGALTADSAKGRPPAIVGREDWLAAFIADNPNATAVDVHAALARAGSNFSYATVRRYMIKHGFAAPKPRRR